MRQAREAEPTVGRRSSGPARRSTHCTGPASGAVPLARGGCDTYWTSSPASRPQFPSCQGSSALAAWSGGRCGVTWRIRMPLARRSNVGGVKLLEGGGRGAQFPRRERQEAVEAIEKGVELRLRAVVRAAADDRFAGVEEQVEDRFVPAREIPGEADHVVERGVRRTQPAHAQQAQRAQN